MQLGYRLLVERTWDGAPAALPRPYRFEFGENGGELVVRIQGPFFGDPPPPHPPGATPELWNFEVAELFLVGANGHYVEIEVGPGGHYLALGFEAYRGAARELTDCTCATRIFESAFSAEFRLAATVLPPGPWRGNAYAIHGEGRGRRYLAAHTVGGGDVQEPDFHRLEAFPLLQDSTPHESAEEHAGS